jgi:hypothetical protein
VDGIDPENGKGFVIAAIFIVDTTERLIVRDDAGSDEAQGFVSPIPGYVNQCGDEVGFMGPCLFGQAEVFELGDELLDFGHRLHGGEFCV